MDNLDYMAWYHIGGKRPHNRTLQKELKLNVVAFACSGKP
jgi:hypothetical protein